MENTHQKDYHSFGSSGGGGGDGVGVGDGGGGGGVDGGGGGGGQFHTEGCDSCSDEWARVNSPKAGNDTYATSSYSVQKICSDTWVLREAIHQISIIPIRKEKKMVR